MLTARNLAPAPPPMPEKEQRLSLLTDLGAMIAREVELDDLLERFNRRVASAMRADRATLWLLDAATGELRSRVADELGEKELRLPVGRGVAGFVARHGESVNIVDASTDQRWAPEFDQQTGYRTKSMLCVPVVDRERRMRGVLQALNKQDDAFDADDEIFLRALAEQVSKALEYTTLRANEIPRGVPLRGPINHIVGSSPAMSAVYERVIRAAATDATVLLRGETGTGKGLFARAIHVNSKRRDGPLVHVDGTNLPAALVESELFGHERGAYTGADKRVVGKVEAATGGTLFIDEIGEIPIELQGKLLRFIQERQYERVGGRETLNADVRIVAATNRDLEQMVQKGEFRSDLYYRIRVVEVLMPPLRVRGASDILHLADHFLGIFARRYGKPSMRFDESALRAMSAHAWPGNVRELEHAIERAVVLAAGNEIDAEALGLTDAPPLKVIPAPTDTASPAIAGDDVRLAAGLTLDEATRRYAQACVDRHGGNRSAAARELDIGRNTLARLLRGTDDAAES